MSHLCEILDIEVENPMARVLDFDPSVELVEGMWAHVDDDDDVDEEWDEDEWEDEDEEEDEDDGEEWPEDDEWDD